MDLFKNCRYRVDKNTRNEVTDITKKETLKWFGHMIRKYSSSYADHT